jgi:hypothetical protein
MRPEIGILVCVAAVVSSGLTGCVLGVPGVHDLKVEAVDLIDADFRGARSRPRIQITFSSRRNLFQYQQNYGWIVLGEFYPCEDGKPKEPPLAASGVFWRNLEVDGDNRRDYAQILEELKKPGGQFYRSVLRIRNGDPNISYTTGKPTWTVYDLQKDPQDVCYQMSGGSLWGYFHSNIAVIPKEAIAMAFERAREEAVRSAR